MNIGLRQILRTVGKLMLRELAQRAVQSQQAKPPAPAARPAAAQADAFVTGTPAARGPVLDPRARPDIGLPDRAPVFTGFDAQKLAADLKLGDDGQPKS